MRKLDRSRDYAENHGFIESPVRYIQDGVNFDSKGLEIKDTPVIDDPFEMDPEPQDDPQEAFSEEPQEAFSEEPREETSPEEPVKEAVDEADSSDEWLKKETTCEICGKVCKSYYGLQLHKRSH